MARQRLRLESLETRLTPAVGIPKSFVIAIDGLRGDGILNANTPFLRSLIDGAWGDGPGIDYRGAYADFATTILDAPTVSGPNHTSIYTGVTAIDHGVTGNNNAQMSAVTFPDYLQLLRNSNSALRAARLVTWGPGDLVPTGAQYRRISSDAANAQLAADIFAGLPGSPYAMATGTTAIDALFLFLDDVDGAGHGNGFSPGIPAYRAEIEQVDSQIGLALTAIRNRPTFAKEDWQIVVTSDHGGRGFAHGVAAADNYTIPFLVTSRSASQGTLDGTPGNVDVLPTVVSHFGFAIPAYVDGIARGTQVRTFPATTLTQDLVANLRFDGTYSDSSGTASPINATVGGGAPTFVPGKFGQAVSLNAAIGDYLTLGNPAALQFGTITDFSFSFWYKTAANQTGNPTILSNKNWTNGGNAGFAISGNVGNGNDIGMNLGDGTQRRDWNFVDHLFNQWWFVGGTFDRDGNAMLYVGSPDNILYKLAQPVSGLSAIESALPWNIGQDGTGAYPNRLSAAIDELAIWRRELRHDEIRTLYANGAGIPVPAVRANPDSYSVNEDGLLSVAAPGVLANDIALAASLLTPPSHGTAIVNTDGSFTYTPQPNFNGTDQFVYLASLGGESATAQVTIAVLPTPDVAAVTVNDGSAQRSRVTALTVAFDSIVSFAGAVANAFTLSRNGGGAAAISASASVVGGVTVVTIDSFTGLETQSGSLRDGRYTLTALATQITDGGRQLNNGLNATFGDSQGLFRFYGDVNGDRRIDISDFGFFSLAYLTPANFNPALDFNNDGRIDISDFGQFSVRFFTTLP